MDPVTTLGLAANIVQFVDFSRRLVCRTRGLYESNTGVSGDHDVLETVCKDLVQLNTALVTSSAASTIPAQYRELASDCTSIAEELLTVLDYVRMTQSHKKWKSFLTALRCVWKERQIEDLITRIERLRNMMQFRLQYMLR